MWPPSFNHNQLRNTEIHIFHLVGLYISWIFIITFKLNCQKLTCCFLQSSVIWYYTIHYTCSLTKSALRRSSSALRNYLTGSSRLFTMQVHQLYFLTRSFQDYRNINAVLLCKYTYIYTITHLPMYVPTVASWETLHMKTEATLVGQALQ